MADDYRSIKVGDIITRMLSGVIPMKLKVRHVDDTLIYAGLTEVDPVMNMGPDTPGLYWTFDRATGAEVDDDLGWGPNHTGSFITSWGSDG